jgi:hypothetical protein
MLCVYGIKAILITGVYMSTDNKPFIIRLRPDTRALLDAAAIDQRRSRASLIDELIRQSLTDRYTGTQTRLDALLGKA